MASRWGQDAKPQDGQRQDRQLDEHAMGHAAGDERSPQLLAQLTLLRPSMPSVCRAVRTVSDQQA